MKKVFITATTYVLASIVTMLCVVPAQSVYAAEVRGASQLNMNEGSYIGENFYAAGGRVSIDGIYGADVAAVALTDLQSKGNVWGDILLIGSQVSFSGTVDGDVRVIGGHAFIDGEVKGDVVAIGGTVVIASNAKVEGDMLVVGGRVIMQSDATQQARVIGGTVRFENTFSGIADVTTQRLEVADNTVIDGQLTYFSPRQARINDKATVNGSVTYNYIEPLQKNGLIEKTLVNFLNFWMLLRFITTLLLAFLLVYVFRVFTQSSVERVVESFPMSVLYGILVSIGTIVVVPVLFVSLILIPVSMLLLLAYIFFYIISGAIAGIALGVLVMKVFQKQSDEARVTINAAVLGVVLLTLVQFVPYAGDIIRIIFTLAALGGIWHYIYSLIRWGAIGIHNK